MRVGYYVHHHGRGHATRASVIGAELARRGHEVTFLGSGVLPEVANTRRVHLPRDAEQGPFPDADGHGRLHFAPLATDYRAFSAAVSSWVAAQSPDVMVVDVSVEVAVLSRLLGVCVVVVAQPGVRTDAAHVLAFDLATQIVAAWPPGFSANRHLAPWAAKTFEVGGISRFKDAEAPVLDAAPARTAALLVGGEGWDAPDLPDQVRAALPELEWVQPGENHSVAEVLRSSAIVVTHAGQNAIADVAAHGVRAVVVPQERPFREQEHMAQALAEDGMCASVKLGAVSREISGQVRDQLRRVTPQQARLQWKRWQTDGAAQRAADVIERAGVNGDVA